MHMHIVKTRLQACAYHFISCAFIFCPFSESPQHRNQDLSSSFFTEEGFLPAKAVPGISSLVRITVFEFRLVAAIFVVIDHPWPSSLVFMNSKPGHSAWLPFMTMVFISLNLMVK